MTKRAARQLSSFVILERLHGCRLRNLRPALFAGPPGIVIPELQHRSAEMLDDIGAIEADILDEALAIRAIKNHVLFFAGRPAALDNHS